jgi:hypothetical protein
MRVASNLGTVTVKHVQIATPLATSMNMTGATVFPRQRENTQ